MCPVPKEKGAATGPTGERELVYYSAIKLKTHGTSHKEREIKKHLFPRRTVL